MEIREAAYKRWDNSVYKIHGKISIRFDLNGDCHLGTGEIFYSGGPPIRWDPPAQPRGCFSTTDAIRIEVSSKLFTMMGGWV